MAIMIAANVTGKQILILQAAINGNLNTIECVGEGGLLTLYYEHAGHDAVQDDGYGHYQTFIAKDNAPPLTLEHLQYVITEWNKSVSYTRTSTEKAKVDIEGCSKPLELYFDINGFFEKAMDTNPTRMDRGKDKGKIVNYDDTFRGKIAEGFHQVFSSKRLDLNKDYHRTDGQAVGSLFVLPGCEDEAQNLEEYASKVVYGDKDNPFPQYVKDTILAMAEKLDVKLVFVDMNPSQSALNQILLMNSDYLITPCLADAESTRAIDRVLNTIIPALTKRFEKFNDKAPPTFLGHVISRVRYSNYQKPPCRAYQDRIDEIRKIVRTWHRRQDKQWRGYTAEIIPEFNSFGILTSGTSRAYSDLDYTKATALRMRLRYLISQIFGNQMREVDQQYLLNGRTFKENRKFIPSAVAEGRRLSGGVIKKGTDAIFSKLAQFFNVGEDEFYEDLSKASELIARHREFLWSIFPWIIRGPEKILAPDNLREFKRRLKSAKDCSAKCAEWVRAQFPDKLETIKEFEPHLLLLQSLEDFLVQLTENDLHLPLESFQELIRRYSESIDEMDEFLALTTVRESYLDALRTDSLLFDSTSLLCRYAHDKGINLIIELDGYPGTVVRRASIFNTGGLEDISLDERPIKKLMFADRSLYIPEDVNARKRKGPSTKGGSRAKVAKRSSTQQTKPLEEELLSSEEGEGADGTASYPQRPRRVAAAAAERLNSTLFAKSRNTHLDSDDEMSEDEQQEKYTP